MRHAQAGQRHTNRHANPALDLILVLLEEELALVAPGEIAAKLADDPRLPLPAGVHRL